MRCSSTHFYLDTSILSELCTTICLAKHTIQQTLYSIHHHHYQYTDLALKQLNFHWNKYFKKWKEGNTSKRRTLELTSPKNRIRLHSIQLLFLLFSFFVFFFVFFWKGQCHYSVQFSGVLLSEKLRNYVRQGGREKCSAVRCCTSSK